MRRSKAHEPWLPAEYSDRDVYAIQSLARGDADASLQVHALKFIVETLSGCYDVTFCPDSERASSFAEGKRHVGLQIVKMTKLNLSALRKTDD